MIPIKIQLKNFLSYGNELQSVDFSPYHMLCLSGKNGHGKSALLDAITWAIWGQARKTSNTIKADHGLLRLGQTHMLVILDFECNGTHYRIRREFALTYGKPYAAIDFGIVDETNDSIAPLTEKTLRATQQKIEDTLRLSYDAFTNSAFLRQGQANEFSKKSAKERKEILAHILGLQRYEEMRKAANDLARQATVEKQQLTAMQNAVMQELAQEETIRAQLREINGRLELEAAQELKLKASITALQGDHKKLIEQQAAYDRLQVDLQALAQNALTKKTKLREDVLTWRNTHAQKLRLVDREKLTQEHAELTQKIERYQTALTKKLEAKELLLKEQERTTLLAHTLRTKHLEATHALRLKLQQKELLLKQVEQEGKALAEKHAELKKALTATENEKIALEKELAAFPRQLHEQTEKRFEKRKSHYQQWVAQATMLKNELDRLQQKRQFTHEEGDTSCPLCEQNLSAARKKFLTGKLAKEEEYTRHRYRRLTGILNNLKQLLIIDHEALAKIKQQHADLQITLHRKQEAEKKLTLLADERAITEKNIPENELRRKELLAAFAQEEQELARATASIDQLLASDEAYLKQRAILTTAEQAFATIAYDQEAHRTAVRKQPETAQALKQYEKMHEEIRLQPERQRRIQEQCLELKALNRELVQLDKHSEEFKTLAERYAHHTAQTQVLKETQEALNIRKEKLLQEKGRYTQQLHHFEKLKIEYDRQTTKMKELTQTAEDYQTLATALGKNGIQALLIEDAIPEIELEANDLLGRLTENQTHIFLESLRDLKSGGTQETLDIKISDAAGIRPYELFSGGEAFRIDFALRIAISKLLARRAGTSLQTLIIDEGFGSQDEDGLSYIMDALYKIQNDFKKIIIVSHLPRLNDQFPVRFCVQKSPSGSSIRIIEQA